MEENLRRKTPIMGWASWNCFRTHISENRMKEQIDALIATGLAECGDLFGGRSGLLRVFLRP